jgi:hypothetical protein
MSRSAGAKIRENGCRSCDTPGNGSAASGHLLIGGDAGAAMAAVAARRFYGVAKSIEPTMDRAKTGTHGLGSFISPPKTLHIYCIAACALQCTPPECSYAKNAWIFSFFLQDCRKINRSFRCRSDV